ncbi:MAG: STAS domain-containing protein [Promethearchaeia archaeon]
MSPSNRQVPIIEIKDNLLISLPTDLDDRSALKIQEEILKKIEKTSPNTLIIEISTLEMVDSFIGRVLTDLAKMAKIMDVITIIAGIQPAVAITLVELGVYLEGIHTALDLDHAIDLANKIKRDRSGDLLKKKDKNDNLKIENEK